MASYYHSFVMRKEQLARRLGKESGITPAAAPGQLDRMISEILPGFGTFGPGQSPQFQFDLSQPLESQRRGSRGPQLSKERR